MTFHDPGPYPPTPRGGQVDDYHGVEVADPYRSLEDADTDETRAWIEAQNRVTFGYLETIPERDRIRERLTCLWNYERFSIPFKEGARYFFFKNTGLQNQSVLYTTRSLDAEPQMLLDPNTLSDNGTVALRGLGISHSGRYLAYSLSKDGSDWQEWKVRDIETREDLADHLQWAKFSGVAWTHDDQGFFYCRYDAPKPGEELQQQNFYHKLCYHRLGTPQSDDLLVYHRPDQKEWFLSGEVTEDGRYLVIEGARGTDPVNYVFYQDLKDPNAPEISTIREDATPSGIQNSDGVIGLFTAGDAHYHLIDNDGPLFRFLIDKDAPRKRIVEIDLHRPQPEQWHEIVPQTTESISSVSAVGDRYFVSYLKDAHTQVKMFDREGRPLGEVALPGIGTANGFGGKRSDHETFYEYTSFTEPGTIYRYDLEKGQSEVYRRADVAFDPTEYETKQVFYTSKDGTRVPMFLTHKKGIRLDGTHPTYLYGYGGFNIPITPDFSTSILVWLEMGGIYAVANLRGGGEYGQEWHDAGRLQQKQTVFDDFIAAAEWLIANGYTSTPKLAIGGGSNGGLLVGACMTQRPDLFGAALPDVGVLDMLRFHKFTVGWGWTSDYGSPDDPEAFKTLYAYSPLHNLRPGVCYPATMVTTGDHDDRVVPAHSFKFIAALQAAQAGDKPVLIRIETQAGHGGGKPTSKVIEGTADRWAFLTRALGSPTQDLSAESPN